MNFLVIQELRSSTGKVKLEGELISLSEAKAARLVALGKITPLNQALPTLPEPSHQELCEPQPLAQPKAKRLAYMVDLPLVRVSKLEKARYEAFNSFLSVLGPTDKMTVPRIQELLQCAPSMVRIREEGVYQATAEAMKRTIRKLSQPKTDSILTHTALKDTFKYRVLQPMELHGKSYQQGDVLESTVDDAHWLLQDGAMQATCYWSKSGDFSFERYQ
jgi:hypothetical protein